jgi:S-adenosylmethionine-dependent methyltransferase
MQNDVHFNTIAEAFEQSVYGSSKGFIRWNVLWEDLLTELPQLGRGGLSILDAGGGAGRMTLALAKLGNHITLVEPAREMLEKAQHSATLEELGGIMFVNQALQDFTAEQPFDIILNHAVLEWLAEPKTALKHLIKQLKPNGYLSLMFHNRNAAIFKNILAGNFSPEFLREESYSSGWSEQTRPLYLETVTAWLDELGVQTLSKAGIRMFHDHLAEEKEEGQLEQLLELEKTLRKREPFASLAQHIHIVGQKR